MPSEIQQPNYLPLQFRDLIDLSAHPATPATGMYRLYLYNGVPYLKDENGDTLPLYEVNQIAIGIRWYSDGTTIYLQKWSHSAWVNTGTEYPL